MLKKIGPLRIYQPICTGKGRKIPFWKSERPNHHKLNSVNLSFEKRVPGIPSLEGPPRKSALQDSFYHVWPFMHSETAAAIVQEVLSTASAESRH